METWDRFAIALPKREFPSVVLGEPPRKLFFNRFLTFTSLIQMDTSNTQAISAMCA